MTIPVLIDTDPGIDDALALLVALSSPELSVEAISTVAGNVDVERATVNLFRVLEIARPAPCPRVARGAAAPLQRPLVSAGHVHGADGLGDLAQFREIDGRPRYPEVPHALEMLDGADLILDAAGRFAGKLVVIALGPLTNLATALRRDGRRLAQVARIVVMGGAVAVPGNVTPAAEFNFYVDPEAAALVLGWAGESRVPLDLVPLDVTRQVVLRRRPLEARLASCPRRLARFIADFTAYGFRADDASTEDGITLHDPLALAAAVEPALLGFEPMCVEVETEGRLTRGLSLADRRALPPHLEQPANCRVAVSVDASRALDFVLERVCPASA
jgi:purine nucleosidase/pyrimidine-specific ribonucleoside hydrolase